MQPDKKVMLQVSSPLPIAQQFEHYEKVLPGAAERILKQAEKEQENRFLNDHRSHESNQQINTMNKIVVRNAHRVIGGAISAIIAVGAILVLNNHDWAGTSIIAVTLVGIATVFVTGKKLHDK